MRVWSDEGLVGLRTLALTRQFSTFILRHYGAHIPCVALTSTNRAQITVWLRMAPVCSKRSEHTYTHTHTPGSNNTALTEQQPTQSVLFSRRL